MKKDCQHLLTLSLKISIQHCSELVQLTPDQLLEHIDRSSFTDLSQSDIYQKPLDVNYIVDNLQECLNNLLDARKKLLSLGFYKLGTDYAEATAREQEIQIRARTEIPEPLEKDEDTDCDSTHLPSDSKMEI